MISVYFYSSLVTTMINTYLNNSALAVDESWFWYLSAPSMDREWAWVWAGEAAGMLLVSAILEALSLVGVVPRGGEVLVGVILGGVDLGVEDLGVLLPLILKCGKKIISLDLFSFLKIWLYVFTWHVCKYR